MRGGPLPAGVDSLEAAGGSRPRMIVDQKRGANGRGAARQGLVARALAGNERTATLPYSDPYSDDNESVSLRPRFINAFGPVGELPLALLLLLGNVLVGVVLIHFAKGIQALASRDGDVLQLDIAGGRREELCRHAISLAC